MAAYAALVSLMNIMEQMQNHPYHSFSFDKKQIESLRQNVDFLLDFLECYNSHGGSKEAEELESKIASAAHEAEDVIESHIVNAIIGGTILNAETSSTSAREAEDVIESHVVDQIHSGSTLSAETSSTAAHEARDVIESHVVDQIHAGSTVNAETSSCLLVGVQKVIEEMESIKKMAMKFKAEREFRDRPPAFSKPATSSRSITTGVNAMVGFDDELIQLLEKLTGQQHNRQIIPIVGMGGIGKTTLARNAFENLLIVQHFDVRLWATISQDYSVEEVLSQILSGKRKSDGGTVHDLGEELYKRLSGKRYLIVLDDLWGVEAWNEIKSFFPDNGNRSRIVITTRISNMVLHPSSSSFVMKFLDEDSSWKLFCEKAFGEEGCPLELQKIGKKIVKKCKGLPLSIVVIGGHLGKCSRTKEYWENIANDISSILNSSDDEQCLKILSLSYNHLPVYLKPCFLYVGIFSEDEWISVSKLIKLWVAEGFLKPNKDQSLEEIAEDYLKDLIERNLILVRTWGRNGKIKTCSIHDLLRELCLKVAEKEKFFVVLDTARAIDRERRLVIHGSTPDKEQNAEVFHALESARLVRSLICEGGELPFDFRLLRVLNWIHGIPPDRYENAIDAHLIDQVNLRYLSFYHFNYVFSSPEIYLPIYLSPTISWLWNLQTLIIQGEHIQVIAPPEIWEMPQLRHVECDRICLPVAPGLDDMSEEQDNFVLRNLQTLRLVENFELSEEVCETIPNVRKLHIVYNCFEGLRPAIICYRPHNLCRFHKLESLELYFTAQPEWRDFVLRVTFPSSLQKLYLSFCFLRWEDLTMIGSLPHLQVLELNENSVTGPEWNPIEGEFPRLKFLKIYRCDQLIYWEADSSHFPVLENLILAGMSGLDEIPAGIGEIPTLRRIELDGCSVSAAISAMRMLVEQEDYGNEGLQLKVRFSGKEECEGFREMMQVEDLTSNNLRLD